MNTEIIAIEQTDIRKLLGAGNADAALLYLYIRSGNPLENAQQVLRLNNTALNCATATLRQLGLWPEERHSTILPGTRPSYTETDVLHAMDREPDFKALYGEVQRLLGKTLNTEELKILLGFTRYLGLSPDVISVLICYCRERSRSRGNLRNPSLRTIEKEAYIWAEQGIDTLEAASAYIQATNVKNTKLRQLMRTLQIFGRNLTAGEEKYATAWLDMGFEMDAIALAYERTCLNTGGLNWAYMNKILTRWQEAGLLSAQAVRNGDRKEKIPKGASGELGQAELEAIKHILKEG